MGQVRERQPYGTADVGDGGMGTHEAIVSADPGGREKPCPPTVWTRTTVSADRVDADNRVPGRVDVDNRVRRPGGRGKARDGQDSGPAAP
ncbi:hypothetical protein Misp02_47590 [Microtetraspora sp. NBRC 16547]|nr:hypothetical protein Misp02_47590 [Microtetraspora sp. NBRC 16547]